MTTPWIPGRSPVAGDAREDQVAEEELNEEPAPAGGSLAFTR